LNPTVFNRLEDHGESRFGHGSGYRAPVLPAPNY
jgi:hypothetical protein